MQSTKLNYVIIYRPFIKDITSNGFFFFLMRSSRLNILAAELFSLVTEVQAVTG